MSKGRFGIHGGQYIPETLMNAVIELEEAYNHYKDDPEFNAELTELLNEYAGRPSRLYFASHMTEDLGGAKVYLKREDLNHTGAHKINNVLTKSTMYLVRYFLQKKWARPVSLQKQAQVSMVWQQQQQQLLWVWNAKSSWERKTQNVRH